MNEIMYESLLHFRIRKILMICSNYDAFILHEDGQIEASIAREYIDLNLSNPPRFIWAETSDRAREILRDDDGIDMVICMYNEQDKGIFALAAELKANPDNPPFVMLMHYSKAIRRKIFEQDTSVLDYVFSWHGSADLILAIIKLFEDLANAENDILGVGVQAILLVEDSVRYYSTYLPELYKLVLSQSHEFLKETLNEDQRTGRKRSRPKILLATNYSDAVAMFEKYKKNLLGVISDVGMVVHKGDQPKDEKLDAGIELVRHIREYDPLMPVLLQSSQASVQGVADELGVGFLRKYSRTLFIQLADYIKNEFGFGDFVFRDAEGNECGRAADLKQLEQIIRDVPDDVLIANTTRNKFSKWFFARGLFTLANRFRAEHHTEAAEARSFLYEQIHAFHHYTGRGIIADFRDETYGTHIWFSRLGDGSLGGKARGLALLNSLIQKYSLAEKYDGMDVSIPRSIVVTTDFFDQFIVENGLQYVIDAELSDDEILSEFVAARLPEALIENLQTFVKTVRHPLAIRSSSKLEDSNYQPFAGVYSTYMIPLTENKDQMVRMLGKAIKSVYASQFYAGSRNYIQSTQNLLSEEKMAVIIQSICGSVHDGLYYPLVSGVGRSVNFYPIGNEKPEEGIVNVAFGLGKTVVEGGRTLRFNPKRPKKILQLSDPGLAMRDTQKMLYALDMRPGAFKISRNEGVNLSYIAAAEVLPSYPWSSLVASTFDRSDGRLRPGMTADGPRVVSFETLLKYNRFPLCQALDEVLEICRKELSCEVEIEFAADIVEENGVEKMQLKLLQVRPVTDYMEGSDKTLEQVTEGFGQTLVTSGHALGAGLFQDMTHVILVPPERFDNLHTKEMAEELSALNASMKAEGASYLLIGPGRWGSSDPFLGIPVLWSDISEARLIVECGIEGFRVEPSQGTHFFQNITSLGVGYLSVDTVSDDGSVNFEALNALPCVHEGKYARVFKTEGLTAFIDRHLGQAVVGL
jgi:hypothetical protein